MRPCSCSAGVVATSTSTDPSDLRSSMVTVPRSGTPCPRRSWSAPSRRPVRSPQPARVSATRNGEGASVRIAHIVASLEQAVGESALELEQRDLALEPACVAGQLAVRADDRGGRGGRSGSGCGSSRRRSRGPRSACRPAWREPAVGRGLAVRDACELAAGPVRWKSVTAVRSTWRSNLRSRPSK